MVANACATQAILSILMNCSDIDIGEGLRNFKCFVEGMDADMKGLAISNSDLIKSVHNSFARPNFFAEDERQDSDEADDAFHFSAFIHCATNGRVYELDGLRGGPVEIGDASSFTDPSQWLQLARDAIQNRIESLSQSGKGEIRFNLMAVIKDREAHLTAERELLAPHGADVAELDESILAEKEKKLQYAVSSDDFAADIN